MSPTGVSLRRRLPSPENDNSFFPSESIHDGEDLKRKVPSGDESVSTCSSPFTERLNDEESHNEADDDSSSCIGESDSSESSKSSLESGEIEEDDESSIEENLIGRKVFVFPMPDDDSSLGSFEDDQSDKDEEEKPMSGDDEDSSSSSEDEDDSIHDPNDHSETEKVSRIPRSFIVGKKYYGSKQPRSFDDSDDMSHDGSSSVDSDESLSSSSEEGARGLGLALDDALSALSDESRDKDHSDVSFGGQEDEVSSVFDSDDDSASNHSFGVSNGKTLQILQSESNQSNVSVFVSMEDELKQALHDNTDTNDNENIDQYIENYRTAVRKDSISIEELNEIINNESSSSDSEIDFSDDEESIPQDETNLTKDIKNESQNAKIKRQLSEGNLSSLNYLDQDSESSPKRFRSSSESSSSPKYEDELSRQHFLVSDSDLPPLPWLNLGPSQASKEVINNNESSPTLSPENEIFDKEYREEIEFELSEELYYPNKNKESNDYSSEVIPLLTPPHEPQDDLQGDFCEWPCNLAVDSAMTEAALSAKPLSPQSLDNDQTIDQLHSVNAVSLDATDCSVSRTLSPPPNLSLSSGLTPRLRGISVYAIR